MPAIPEFENLAPPCVIGFPSGYYVCCFRLQLFYELEINTQGPRCIQLTNIPDMSKKEKKEKKEKEKKKKRKKRTALVICRDRKQFWTTQTQFWQWVREGVVAKTGDNPLTGAFNREHEELMVLLSNTVLNLAHPNHVREALLSRRVGLARK